MNLLDPLAFEDGEIDKFLQTHVCAFCLGHLNKFPAPGRQWIAKCTTHGPVLSHNAVKVWQAEQVQNGILTAQRELREPVKTTETELLKSLGF